MKTNEYWEGRVTLLTEDHARRVMMKGLTIEEGADNLTVYRFGEKQGIICRHPDWPENYDWVYRLLPFGEIRLEYDSLNDIVLAVMLQAIGEKWRVGVYDAAKAAREEA